MLNRNNNNNLPPPYEVKILSHALNTDHVDIMNDIFHTIINFLNDGFHFMNSTQVVVHETNSILTTLYFVYNNVSNNNNTYNNNNRELAMQNYEQRMLSLTPQSGSAKPKAKKEPKESKSKKTKKEKM
jgi:hypothetical protein